MNKKIRVLAHKRKTSNENFTQLARNPNKRITLSISDRLNMRSPTTNCMRSFYIKIFFYVIDDLNKKILTKRP